MDIQNQREMPLPSLQSGKTTGASGALFALLDVASLKKRMHHAKTTLSKEGKFHAALDLAALPQKILISLFSIGKQILQKIEPASALVKIGLAASLTAVLVALIFLSGIYLAFEGVRTAVELAKSLRFEKKEAIGKTLDLLENLTVSQQRSLDEVKDYLQANKEEILQSLGDLRDMIWSKDPDEQLLQIRAILSQKKVANLFHFYVGENAFAKHTDYLSRRIGPTSTKAFQEAAREIDDYQAYDISTLNKEELTDFTERAENILRMLERQRKKVLKIHALSVASITVAATALVLTSPLTHIGLCAASIYAISTGAGVVGGARAVAEDSYLAHTGEGINPRLVIPKALCAKEGETNFSIWRNASTVKKVFYVGLSILTLGLPVIFDALFKSSFITSLRGRADEFTHQGATFSMQNMKITSIYQ